MLFSVPVITTLLISCSGLPVLAAGAAPTVVVQEEQEQQEQQEQQEVSQEEIEKYEEVERAAKKERVDTATQSDSTGTDPRVFANKWMPYYRYTKLENGLTQHDVTAFGTVAFSPVVGMFYELPFAQYLDFSEVPGLPPGSDTDAIGMGDWNLKFLVRPRALDFHYGQGGEMSGSVLFGTEFVLPTATNDALGGDSFLFAPIVAVVVDMPFYGFFAALNLYQFDVFKNSSAPDTSRSSANGSTCSP